MVRTRSQAEEGRRVHLGAAALDGPVEGLETGCTVTADGQIVLLHDPLVHRGTTLTGWARDLCQELAASR